MDKIFEKQIGNIVEVYVDDVLVKSASMENHQRDLEETFKKLRKAGIKLKLEKCTFGVKEGKFLGYLISSEGIKPHPEKIEAISNMRPPKNLKEVQKLNGKIVALSRFIPKSTADSSKFSVNQVKPLDGTKNVKKLSQNLKKY